MSPDDGGEPDRTVGVDGKTPVAGFAASQVECSGRGLKGGVGNRPCAQFKGWSRILWRWAHRACWGHLTRQLQAQQRYNSTNCPPRTAPGPVGASLHHPLDRFERDSQDWTQFHSRGSDTAPWRMPPDSGAPLSTAPPHLTTTQSPSFQAHRT